MDPAGTQLQHLRNDYDAGPFTPEQADADPVVQFGIWMQAALQSGIQEPNAMNLSTVSEDGMPSSRIVLLRNFDQNGYVFYTNYLSQKGKELAQNPKCALNFFWPQLHRQIRIMGTTSKVEASDSDAYFESRPWESQVAALASNQSDLLNTRSELDLKFEELKKQFHGKPVARPAWWGGYRMVPSYYEFWQGRPNRLHDRLAYIPGTNGSWIRKLLFP